MNKRYPYEIELFECAKAILNHKTEFKDTGIKLSTKIDIGTIYSLVNDLSGALNLKDIYLGSDHYRVFRPMMYKKIFVNNRKEATVRCVIHTTEEMFRKHINNKKLYHMQKYTEELLSK